MSISASALGAWIRYSPFRNTSTSAASGVDADEIPRDEPAPDRGQAGAPISDDLLDLLHTAGPTRLAATLHQWLDIGALAASVLGSARRAGLGGLGLLIDAVSEKTRAGHVASEIRFARPGTYQIDHRSELRRLPTTIACDGQRHWEVYSDKITSGPAQGPPHDIGNVVDPSCLLQCTLASSCA